MIRRPPRSTLFPTRRSSDLQDGGQRLDHRKGQFDGEDAEPVLREEDGDQAGPSEPEGHHQEGRRRVAGYQTPRSEEHTSELQSRQYLVCRLLLEKKKTKKQTRTHGDDRCEKQVQEGAMERSQDTRLNL